MEWNYRVQGSIFITLLYYNFFTCWMDQKTFFSNLTPEVINDSDLMIILILKTVKLIHVHICRRDIEEVIATLT